MLEDVIKGYDDACRDAFARTFPSNDVRFTISGVSQTPKYGIANWVIKYYGDYDESKGYEDRKAVGFLLEPLDGNTLPTFLGLQTGFLHILNNWDIMAESFPKSGKLPKPKIVIVTY